MINIENLHLEKVEDGKSDFFQSFTDEDKSQIMELSKNISNFDMKIVKQTMESLVGYKELLTQYNCAIKEIKTKFDVLNTEFSVTYQRNPISYIQTRLKCHSSIFSKLIRKNLPFTVQSIEQNINDVAGIRIICAYEDDIYRLASALASQDDVTVLTEKDYIKNPKPNGYRSYHMIVSVPVFFASGRKPMKVEVQIRTIAMDTWASLEHQLKYKQEIKNEAEIVEKLKACADSLAETDKQMLAIRQKLEESHNKPSEEEILLAKLSMIDKPII